MFRRYIAMIDHSYIFFTIESLVPWGGEEVRMEILSPYIFANEM
ncbi:MAG: hypothetical protein QXE01_06830 [Sulfolobales archaeon]